MTTPVNNRPTYLLDAVGKVLLDEAKKLAKEHLLKPAVKFAEDVLKIEDGAPKATPETSLGGRMQASHGDRARQLLVQSQLPVADFAPRKWSREEVSTLTTKLNLQETQLREERENVKNATPELAASIETLRANATRSASQSELLQAKEDQLTTLKHLGTALDTQIVRTQEARGAVIDDHEITEDESIAIELTSKIDEQIPRIVKLGHNADKAVIKALEKVEAEGPLLDKAKLAETVTAISKGVALETKAIHDVSLVFKALEDKSPAQINQIREAYNATYQAKGLDFDKNVRGTMHTWNRQAFDALQAGDRPRFETLRAEGAVKDAKVNTGELGGNMTEPPPYAADAATTKTGNPGIDATGATNAGTVAQPPLKSSGVPVIVKEGDWLSRMAANAHYPDGRHVTLEELRRVEGNAPLFANDARRDTGGNYIYPGDKVYLPEGATFGKAPAAVVPPPATTIEPAVGGPTTRVPETSPGTAPVVANPAGGDIRTLGAEGGRIYETATDLKEGGFINDQQFAELTNLHLSENEYLIASEATKNLMNGAAATQGQFDAELARRTTVGLNKDITALDRSQRLTKTPRDASPAVLVNDIMKFVEAAIQ